MIYKNVIIKHETLGTREVLDYIIDFSKFLNQYSRYLPHSLAEILLLEKIILNPESVNAKVIKSKLLKLFCSKRIRWELVKSYDKITIIKKAETVQEKFIIPTYVIFKRMSSGVEKMLEVIQAIKRTHIFYKEHRVRFKFVYELSNLLLAITKKELNITRFKGLGEMNPEQLWNTTLNPSKRTVLNVKVQDSNKARRVFEALMGDNIKLRKRFIIRNSVKINNVDF